MKKAGILRCMKALAAAAALTIVGAPDPLSRIGFISSSVVPG